MWWIYVIKNIVNPTKLKLTWLINSHPTSSILSATVSDPCAQPKQKSKLLRRQIWISGSCRIMMSLYSFFFFFLKNTYLFGGFSIWGLFNLGIFQQACLLELSHIAWTEYITRAYTPSSGNYRVESKSKVSYQDFIFSVTNTWKLGITT